MEFRDGPLLYSRPLSPPPDLPFSGVLSWSCAAFMLHIRSPEAEPVTLKSLLPASSQFTVTESFLTVRK